MLDGAGVRFEIDPADLDEASIKAGQESAGSGTEAIAAVLAVEKARAVSARHPGRLVLGADQIMDLDGRRFDKPADMAEARQSLIAIRGRTHRLVTAAAVVRDDREIWSRTTVVSLTARRFSDSFLDRYLAEAGPDILKSVGAYRLEGIGVQLFEAVDGDYFTILGLPLLSLLDFLRRQGVLSD